MAQNKHRVAVIGGAGSRGRHCTRAYAAHPDCEIVALVDRARPLLIQGTGIEATPQVE